MQEIELNNPLVHLSWEEWGGKRRAWGGERGWGFEWQGVKTGFWATFAAKQADTQLFLLAGVFYSSSVPCFSIPSFEGSNFCSALLTVTNTNSLTIWLPYDECPTWQIISSCHECSPVINWLIAYWHTMKRHVTRLKVVAMWVKQLTI